MGKNATAGAIKQINALIGGKGKSRKKGKKGRKIGRYGRHPSSMRYRGERRWETNKVKRMARHLKRHPNDEQARSLLSQIG